jgi:hypothetical protein
MKQLRLIGIFSALVGMWAAFGTGEIIPVSQAEPVKPSKLVKTEYQYAAKVACSLLQPHQDGSLARGTYRTAVNIHNPTNKEITIAAKVALATEFGSEAGPFAVTPIKNPAASSGVFALRTTQADNLRVASDMFYLDFIHTCQSSAHPHACQPYLQNNHQSKTLHPRASS